MPAINNSYRGHNIVFIIGCPRSGTTWLQRLLICHPKIRSGQESDLFDMFIGPQLRAWQHVMNPSLSGRPVGLSCYFSNMEFHVLLKNYMLNLLRPMIGNLRQGEIFIEKSPSHALYIPEIMEMLPESRIIHLLRDPRDVVSSLLAASKSWGKHWAPQSAQGAAQMWVKHVQAFRESASQFSEASFFELRYEDLSDDTEQALKDLCAFLKLEWSEAEIIKAVSDNTLELAKRNGGSVIPIGGELAAMFGTATKEPDGFFRKGQPGAWKNDLTEEEAAIVCNIAGHLMKEAGYE